MSADMLEEELKAIGYQSSKQQCRTVLAAGQQFSMITRGFKFCGMVKNPRTVQINIQDGQVDSVINLNNNKPNTLIRLEPKLIGKIYPVKQEDRLIVCISREVPKFLVSALIFERSPILLCNGISVPRYFTCV
ncbi:MAG: hypothetical protein R3E08_14510 [Thiotrichaceae bacterium]